MSSDKVILFDSKAVNWNPFRAEVFALAMLRGEQFVLNSHCSKDIQREGKEEKAKYYAKQVLNKEGLPVSTKYDNEPYKEVQSNVLAMLVLACADSCYRVISSVAPSSKGC